MLKDTFRAQTEEIVVDMFAGAGGASCGLELAGIHVHAAINHDPVAVSLHARNHPETEHHVQDVYTLSPQWVTRGRRVGLLWMSPDCTHHSKAKGGAPTRNVRRRELAMVLVDRWIPELGDRAPRVVILENVEEFAEWGPLDNRGRIIEAAKGERFRTFVRKLRSCGYRVGWRELRACDYGAPTIRKRLFMIARRDNRPIVWPKPTHGAPDSPDVLAGTVTTIDHHSLCAAHMVKMRGSNVGDAADAPLHTVSAGGTHHALCTAHLQRDFGNSIGAPCGEPVPTVMPGGGGKTALVSAFLAKYYGQGFGCAADEPLHTITTKDRFGLVTVCIAGTPYFIADIGMRMLTPRELARAQGFPDWYVLEQTADGIPITKTAQVRGIGNSVCPPIAAALAAANYSPQEYPVPEFDMPLLALA